MSRCACPRSRSRRPTATDPVRSVGVNGLAVRGISYFTDEVPLEQVCADLAVIREDLHCTAVMLIGADPRELADAARQALQIGVDVYVRPHLADGRPAEVLTHLAITAAAAEELRLRYPGRVTLLVGTEFSLTTRGMVPGRWAFLRLQVILRLRRFLDRRITRRLNALLADALATARREFAGPVTYGAAFWEHVDWSAFDVVGVNLYRLGTDPDGYERRLRALVRDAGKPVVVTEFGCGAHVGADRRGPGSFLIVNWFADPPRVREGHVRDERVQADYLAELIDLYSDAGVHGCFVFTFSMPDFPHHADPRHDLDMAGFGVVKVAPGEPPRWEPKQAFDEVARRYGSPARSRPVS
jgi:hypothetical protein